MELLRAEGVSFRYGAPDTLLSVSLGLQTGQKLGLVGPNGSGKTTLLKLLAGELKPEEGRVVRAPGLRVGRLGEGLGAGRTLWEVSEGALDHVRALERTLREEEARLSAGEDRLAAYGDVFEAFEAAGGYRAEEGLRASLAAFGFDEARYEQEVSTLSGGEGARLALAVLLAEGADVLLLDEPSNGLDLTTRRAALEGAGANQKCIHPRVARPGALGRGVYAHRVARAGPPHPLPGRVLEQPRAARPGAA